MIKELLLGQTVWIYDHIVWLTAVKYACLDIPEVVIQNSEAKHGKRIFSCYLIHKDEMFTHFILEDELDRVDDEFAFVRICNKFPVLRVK